MKLRIVEKFVRWNGFARTLRVKKFRSWLIQRRELGSRSRVRENGQRNYGVFSSASFLFFVGGTMPRRPIRLSLVGGNPPPSAEGHFSRAADEIVAAFRDEKHLPSGSCGLRSIDRFRNTLGAVNGLLGNASSRVRRVVSPRRSQRCVVLGGPSARVPRSSRKISPRGFSRAKKKENKKLYVTNFRRNGYLVVEPPLYPPRGTRRRDSFTVELNSVIVRDVG